MTTVKHGVVPLESIPAVHIAQSVDKPQVSLALLVLHHHVSPHGASGLHNEVFFERVGLVRVGGVVREQLVAVEIRQLGEVLDVPLRVDVQPLRQVKFKSCHSVVGRLQAVHDLTLFAVGQLDVVLQVLRPRQEAVEQVDDVPIRVGADHVLGVHPSCCLESKTFARLVLDAKPRLHPPPCKRTVVLQAKARLNDPRATLHRVVHVASELCGVFLLLDRHLQRIERLKVGLHAHHFQAVLHVVLSKDVFEVEAKVEALHLAVPRGRTDFVKVDAVVAQCEMAVQ